MPRPPKKSEYYVVDLLKERMEADENFTKEQVRGFTKRLKTDSFRFVIENYQKCHNRCMMLSELIKEKNAEIRKLVEEMEDLEEENDKLEKNLNGKNLLLSLENSNLKKRIEELESKERKSL